MRIFGCRPSSVALVLVVGLWFVMVASGQETGVPAAGMPLDTSTVGTGVLGAGATALAWKFVSLLDRGMGIGDRTITLLDTFLADWREGRLTLPHVGIRVDHTGAVQVEDTVVDAAGTSWTRVDTPTDPAEAP